MAKLIAQSGHSLDLPGGRVTFGESPSCSVPLAAGLGLAPVHFEIIEDSAGNYILHDLTGTGGVLVDGEPAARRELKHGSVIAAGQLQLAFWNEVPAPRSHSPFNPAAVDAVSGKTTPVAPPRVLSGAQGGRSPAAFRPAKPVRPEAPCPESAEPRGAGPAAGGIPSLPPMPVLEPLFAPAISPAPLPAMPVSAPVPVAAMVPPPAAASTPGPAPLAAPAPVPPPATSTIPVTNPPPAPEPPASGSPMDPMEFPSGLPEVDEPEQSFPFPGMEPSPAEPFATADAPQAGSGNDTVPVKPRRAPGGRRLHLRFVRSRGVIVALFAIAGGAAAAAMRTAPVKTFLAGLMGEVDSWGTAGVTAPKPQLPPQDSAAAPAPALPAAARATHDDVVKKMLNERTIGLFQADLRQLVPFYNASASARNLPPQKEMAGAFLKYYGMMLDGFDKLTCLRARGRGEFVFVLTSSSAVDLKAVLGESAEVPPAKTGKGKSIRIHQVKPAGRVFGVAQFDPYTVVLGSRSWIETALNAQSSPAIREVLGMFPETASRNPGALIMVDRIMAPPGSKGPQTFQTAVSNLFFKGKGESRLTLTRNPDVAEETFVEQSSAALREQAGALAQAMKLGESLARGNSGAPANATAANAKPPKAVPVTMAPAVTDAGEVISSTEASILIPDGEALLREAIDSVAQSFMSQSPSVELILAAQKAVLNFNQARLRKVAEACAVSSVAEALELLQNGIAAPNSGGGTDTFQIDRLTPQQADEILHLLALEDKAGLVFRPNADQLSGAMLELALKARDYRNAELLISLWTAARFNAADTPDVNTAVRKVTEWANGEGARQRLSVGLPALTSAEYRNAVALLSIQNGQLTWKPGEEGYRTWLRRLNPDPKGTARRIAGVFEEAQRAGIISPGQVSGLAEAVRLIHTGVRTGGSAGSAAVFSTGPLTAEQIQSAARYLRFEGGALSVVER